MSEYKEEDVVIVGWPTSGGPPEVESTQVNCHKCGQPVWVSHASMNTVLDKKTETGGELYVVCIMCAPEPDDPNHEIQIGEEQKAEMLALGLDIDDFIRRSGLSLTEIAKMVVERAQALEELRSLHRAANRGPGGCGNPRCRVCNPQKV
jgi:cytochrome oxidase assembly protein ShyY1